MSVRVLLVDDDPDVRLVLTTMLSTREGWEVVGELEDGADVVAAAEQLRPDILLLDLAMETPGDMVIPQLIRRVPDCMITVFSALPASQNRARLLRLGAFSYLEKGRLRDLPDIVGDHYAMFRRALAGEDVAAPWVYDGVTA